MTTHNSNDPLESQIRSLERRLSRLRDEQTHHATSSMHLGVASGLRIALHELHHATHGAYGSAIERQHLDEDQDAGEDR